MTTEPVNQQPVHVGDGPVSLGEAVNPASGEGAVSLAGHLVKALELLGNAPGVVRVAARAPEPCTGRPVVTVRVADPGYVYALAARHADRFPHGHLDLDLGDGPVRVGLIELDAGPSWVAVHAGVEVFVYTDAPTETATQTGEAVTS